MATISCLPAIALQETGRNMGTLWKIQGFFLSSVEKSSPDQRPTFALSYSRTSCFTCQFTSKAFSSEVNFPFGCEPCNTRDMRMFLDSVREHTHQPTPTAGFSCRILDWSSYWLMRFFKCAVPKLAVTANIPLCCITPQKHWKSAQANNVLE